MDAAEQSCRTPAPGCGLRNGELAGHAPAANAHVREQQDDEDDRKDDPSKH
jgi:hypothetical protein